MANIIIELLLFKTYCLVQQTLNRLSYDCILINVPAAGFLGTISQQL